MVEYSDFHTAVATLSPVLILAALVLARPNPAHGTKFDIAADAILLIWVVVLGAVSTFASLLVLAGSIQSTELRRHLLVAAVAFQLVGALFGKFHSFAAQGGWRPGQHVASFVITLAVIGFVVGLVVVAV
jgi:hypothetical protein